MRGSLGWTRVALSSALAAWASPVLAQTPVPQGPQFQVNTYTTGQQFADGVAIAPGGDFLVLWSSSGALDSSTVEARRFAADGSPVGPQFQVDTATGLHLGSSVSMAGDGDFVVVWSEINSFVYPRPSLWDVAGQRYASDGSAAGANFQVNAVTTGTQYFPDVAQAADGGFVVVWQNDPPSGPDTTQARIFDANGSPVTGDFTVASGDEAVVAAAPSGDFTVVWSGFASSGTDTGSLSVQARRYAADGSPLGAPFQVNTYTTGLQNGPDVAATTGGGFVVVWTSAGSSGTDTSSSSVQGQRFAADGSPAGGEFQVNSSTTGLQNVSSVAADTDGGFVVVWQSNPVVSPPPAPGNIDLFGQHFGADGSPLGAEFQVNSYTTSQQYGPVVATGDDGFVVAWSSLGSAGTDVDQRSVQARRFVFGVPTAVPALPVALTGAAGLSIALAARGILRRRR